MAIVKASRCATFVVRRSAHYHYFVRYALLLTLIFKYHHYIPSIHLKKFKVVVFHSCKRFSGVIWHYSTNNYVYYKLPSNVSNKQVKLCTERVLYVRLHTKLLVCIFFCWQQWRFRIVLTIVGYKTSKIFTCKDCLIVWSKPHTVLYLSPIMDCLGDM